ncbi:hypothetical protein BROUX41_005094 [Berkeleyomyces rouxiae]|uniref:uncharacterized protein n=1 Tax=Berkeleyomyces rouxiae TaxID=2035830 RepID=UPI003B81883F
MTTTADVDLAYQHVFEPGAVGSVAGKGSSLPSPPSSSSSSQSSAQSSSVSSLSTHESSPASDPAIAGAPSTSSTPTPPRRHKSVVAAFFSRSRSTAAPKQKVPRSSNRIRLNFRRRKSVLYKDTTPIFEAVESEASRPTATPPTTATFGYANTAPSNINEDPNSMATEFQVAIDQAFPVPPGAAHSNQKPRHPQPPAVLSRPRRISSLPGGGNNAQRRQHPHHMSQQSPVQRQAQGLPMRQQRPSGPAPYGPAPTQNVRTPSWNTNASFDSILSSTPSEQPFPTSMPCPTGNHPHPHFQPLLNFTAPLEQASFKPKYATGELFVLFPGNVLELILDELKALHLKPGSDSCSSCWTRDLCSIALSSRKWSKFARTSLYEDIQIVGSESLAMKKRHKTLEFPRLALLRRTLRSSQQIAVVVKTMRVPVLTPGMNKDSYYNTVASIIMACPNFERLVALYPAYDHSFNRLFHALSTRSKLRHMDWVLEPAPLPTPPARPMSSRGSQLRSRLTPLNIAPTNLNNMQSDAWLDLHSCWSHLTTLNIHALPGGALIPNNLVVEAIRQLPKLQHLFLSNLSYAAFNDEGLISLPSLKTLSMTRLDGITDKGISAFANRLESRSLVRLDLRHLNIESFASICRVFASVTSLKKLVFVQARAPIMPAEDMFCLMPYVTSASLQSLHWDITTPIDPTCTAPGDVVLARSIGAQGFPALRSIRVPADPEGLFQSLCHPVDRLDLPNDRFRLTGSRAPALRSPPATPTSAKSITGRMPFVGSPSTPLPTVAGMVTTPVSAGPGSSEPPIDARPASHLVEARLLAQARIENAWRFPRFFAHVIDENGNVIERFGLGGFIGDMQSKIEYNLLPDRHATDAAGGLVDMGHILAARHAEMTGMDLCTGRWNMTSEGAYDKKDRERWWHAESPRWTQLEL